MERGARIPRKQNDSLLKGAFEDNFADFLRFIIPDADEKYNLSGKFVFLDKELRTIVPDRKRKRGGRVADLLVKVFLKNGKKSYFLVNTEIEGGSDPEFAKRMLQYNYRIWDKYDAPVTSIAFYTGGPKQPRPSEYSREWEGTLHYFRFLAYHIFDHTEAELLAMDNPFAIIVLACQKSLLEGKIPDKELGRIRLTIARELVRRGYSRERVISLLEFIKNFLYVRDPKINRIFDEELTKFSEGEINMGVIEVVKAQQRELGEKRGLRRGLKRGREEGLQEGIERGLQEGIERGLQKGIERGKREIVENLIEKMGLSDEQVVNIAGVSLGFVRAVRTELPDAGE